MDNNDPRKPADEPVMRPIEEMENDDRFKHYDPARQPAQSPEAEEVNLAAAHFQAGNQNTTAPVAFDDIREALRETPEEVRDAEEQMGDYQKWDDGSMKADGGTSKLK